MGWKFSDVVRFNLGPLLHCKTRIAKLESVDNSLIIMSTPLGGGYIIFAFFAVRCPMSGVRCPASRMVSAHLKEKYLSYCHQIWYAGLLGQ